VKALDPEVIGREVITADLDIREGRFQRWLSLIAGLSSLLAGLEVSYEHYRGSYSNRVMYTPVILGGALGGTGIWGFVNRWAATKLLRTVSIVTLLDSVIGFGFHIRGVQRKPGGWRVPVFNIVMGPPIFAPLLFGVSGYLGLVASYLRRGNMKQHRGLPLPAHRRHWAVHAGSRHERIGWRQDIREGRFQKHLAFVTVISAFFSGFEALYSHYKNNFRYLVQWTPILVAPSLMAAGALSLRNRRAGHTWLPALSAVAIINGGIGFFYHARGVLRRPAGLKKPVYNVIYGPPIFAPLLFAASGFLGLLASLMRREKP
jgi:hypothetical protein